MQDWPLILSAHVGQSSMTHSSPQSQSQYHCGSPFPPVQPTDPFPSLSLLLSHCCNASLIQCPVLKDSQSLPTLLNLTHTQPQRTWLCPPSYEHSQLISLPQHPDRVPSTRQCLCLLVPARVDRARLPKLPQSLPLLAIVSGPEGQYAATDDDVVVYAATDS